MERVWVRPKEGLRVIDPENRRPIPAEGADVPRNTYWTRRLRDGDVTESAPPRVVAAPSKAQRGE
jgi:hypothetical protein